MRGPELRVTAPQAPSPPPQQGTAHRGSWLPPCPGLAHGEFTVTGTVREETARPVTSLGEGQRHSAMSTECESLSRCPKHHVLNRALSGALCPFTSRNHGSEDAAAPWRLRWSPSRWVPSAGGRLGPAWWRQCLRPRVLVALLFCPVLPAAHHHLPTKKPSLRVK